MDISFFLKTLFEDKDLLMNNYLDQVKRHVKDGYAVIIIDDSDIAKPASRKLEALSEIKDGSGINNGRRRHPQEPERGNTHRREPFRRLS